MPPSNPDDPFGFKSWLQPEKPIEPASDALMKAMAGYGSSTAASTPLPEKSPIVKLQDSITFAKNLLKNKRVNKATIAQWLKQVRAAVFYLFGKDSAIYKNLNLIVKEAEQSGLSQDLFIQKLADTEALLDYLNKIAASPLSCEFSQTSRVPTAKNIFIIHGHDERNALSLSQLLRDQFNLKPIIILASAGMSRYLSDKFEHDAQTCSFAFALFTPDDEVVNSGQTYNQARPNVFYETGWFIGRLGRPRVILLLKSGAKIHSDLEGVSRIEFASKVEEKFIDIQNELRAAKIIA
jgi:predicted nucleotide-binding protein